MAREDNLMPTQDIVEHVTDLRSRNWSVMEDVIEEFELDICFRWGSMSCDLNPLLESLWNRINEAYFQTRHLAPGWVPNDILKLALKNVLKYRRGMVVTCTSSPARFSLRACSSVIIDAFCVIESLIRVLKLDRAWYLYVVVESIENRENSRMGYPTYDVQISLERKE